MLPSVCGEAWGRCTQPVRKKTKRNGVKNFIYESKLSGASLAIIGKNDWGDLNKYVVLLCSVFVVASQ